DVDLTAGSFNPVSLPDDVLEKWIGGTALGLHLLAQELVPGMKPTDPDAPIFIVTGPLTGTTAPQSSNWTIVSLNTVSPEYPGVGQAHGHWGARLKWAGWDGVFIRGISPKPVYLWIENEQVELRDAASYWGMDTFETPRRIKLELGDPLQISVACIGPGGENLITGAAVRSDGFHTAARGEAGIAWGSKQLKAIAVRGTGRAPIADPEGLMQAYDDWNRALYATDTPPPTQHAHAVMPHSHANIESHGRVQGKNYSDPEFQVRWSKRWVEDAPKWKVRPVAGFNCEMSCHHETLITTGPLAGSIVAGYGGEIIQQTGPNLGIDDPGVALAINGLVDGMGLDGGEVPRNIAMVMEAYNTERLNRDEVDGLDLTWGNYEAVIELLEKTVRREGIGASLAKPPRECGRDLGIEDLAVHMKGTGFNDHDMRIHPGLIFQFLIAGAGPVWQTELGLVYPPRKDGLPEMGYEYLDPTNPDGMVEPVYKGQLLKLWDDTLGVCYFALRGTLGTWDPAIRALSSAVGWEGYTREEALLVGERLVNLQRLMALRMGYQREYDYDISPRMLAGLDAGPAKDKTIPAGPHLERWFQEYYECLDWDLDTGAPTADTLRRLGMSDLKVGQAGS
ncbi:MAG: aldehyde ferredoxin oxidoreductase C-terminal domain-containing protein, partial [Planctomycetota bacterium]|nr:aldehyde ferredoxin oxidoreductase C-terminal domain-containing protein [Planctomycetota bacterium]